MTATGGDTHKAHTAMATGTLIASVRLNASGAMTAQKMNGHMTPMAMAATGLDT